MLWLTEISRKFGSIVAIAVFVLSVAVLYITGFDPLTVIVRSLVISFVVYLVGWGLFTFFGGILAEALEEKMIENKEELKKSADAEQEVTEESGIKEQKDKVYIADDVEVEPREETVVEEIVEEEAEEETAPEVPLGAIIEMARQEMEKGQNE